MKNLGLPTSIFGSQLSLVRSGGGSRISDRGRGPIWGGRGTLTWALFGENICENERIGSHEGGRAPEHFVCTSANGNSQDLQAG